jgi:hypothetical protein
MYGFWVQFLYRWRRYLTVAKVCCKWSLREVLTFDYTIIIIHKYRASIFPSV